MECFSVNDVLSEINTLQSVDLLIVDIDDTIITPKALMFRPKSPWYNFVDNLKKEASQMLPEILSTWRTSRKAMLVEDFWPKIIKDLKVRGVKVIALTMMNTGAFGKIPSVERWRADELESLGINFSDFASDQVETIIEHQDLNKSATLYRGILFAGGYPKDVVLNSFIQKHSVPTKILFFDDRLEQIQLLDKYCEANNISYGGYHYRATERLPYDEASDFGEIQTKTLIESHQWLEDEDAKKLQKP